MYVSSDSACNMQSGETPVSPAALAAAQAINLSADASVIHANSNWAGLIDRNWLSFQDLGPYVALQLRNAALAPGTAVAASATPSPGTPAPAAPVDLVSQGNSDGTNPAAGGAGSTGPLGSRQAGASIVLFGGGKSRRRHNASNDPLSDAAFVRRFGSPPLQVYTGPPVEPGSVLSLVYGGAHDPLLTGPGVAAAATPDQRYGYSSNCPNPAGVSMTPWGEPVYPANPAGGSAAGSSSGSSSWLMWGLLGLGLVGLAWADKSDKKSGRAKAA